MNISTSKSETIMRYIFLKKILLVLMIWPENLLVAEICPGFKKKCKTITVKHATRRSPVFILPDVSGEETVLENAPFYQFVVADYNPVQDFESIKKIMKNNWEFLVSCCPYDDELVDYLFEQEKSANYPNHNLIIKTVKNNNCVVGFIGYVLHSSLNDYYSNSKPRPFAINPPCDAGHIEIIAIDESCRRSGAGSLLLNFAIDDLISKGAKKINLAVAHSNSPALRCYKKLGFVPGVKYDKDTIILVKNI